MPGWGGGRPRNFLHRTFRIFPPGLDSSKASWELAQWTRGHVWVGCWPWVNSWALSLSFLLWGKEREKRDFILQRVFAIP